MDAPQPSRPSRPLRWLLLFFGAVVAPSLAALGLFGLEDLGLVAEARLRRDAALSARGLQSEWEARLTRQDPIAMPQAHFKLPAGDLSQVLQGRDLAAPRDNARLPATAPARLHALAARAELAGGDVVEARGHIERIDGGSPRAQAEVVVAIAQGLRLLGDAGGRNRRSRSALREHDFEHQLRRPARRDLRETPGPSLR